MAEHRFFRKHFKRFQTLTPKEMLVLQWLVQGFDHEYIANRLKISYFTVLQHRKNIIRKLEVKSYFDLLKYAQAFDLI